MKVVPVESQEMDAFQISLGAHFQMSWELFKICEDRDIEVRMSGNRTLFFTTSGDETTHVYDGNWVLVSAAGEVSAYSPDEFSRTFRKVEK